MRRPSGPFMFFRFTGEVGGDILLSTGRTKAARSDLVRDIVLVSGFAREKLTVVGREGSYYAHSHEKPKIPVMQSRSKRKTCLLLWDGESAVEWHGVDNNELGEVSRYATGLMASVS